MKNSVSFKAMLAGILFLPLLLIISDSQGGDVCLHEVWAPTDCKVQVFRVKGGLEFIINSSKRVESFQLEISEEMPDMNGNFTHKKCSRKSKKDVKMWTTDCYNLSPDTLNYYVLKVIDKKGCQSHKVGAHWTNVRSFHLNISKIHVYEDGDAGPRGKGECEFYAYGNGKQMLKYGSIYKSWVTAGQTINANVSGILKNIGPGNLTLKILGREADLSSGSILEPENTYDKASKTITLDLKEWEKNNPAEKEFEVRVQGDGLDFKTFCKGLVYYNKGENRWDPDVSYLNPEKPSVGPQPVGGSDKMKEDPLLRFYQPPPPIIHYPIDNYLFYDVPVNIEGVSEKNKPPIIALRVETQRYNPSCGNQRSDTCWISEVVHPGAQNIKSDSINVTIGNDKFKFKGNWRIRAQSVPRTGRPSKWTAWRNFQVK